MAGNISLAFIGAALGLWGAWAIATGQGDGLKTGLGVAAGLVAILIVAGLVMNT